MVQCRTILPTLTTNYLLPPHQALLLIREERQWEIGWSVRNEIA